MPNSRTARMEIVGEASASRDGKPLPAYPAGTPCVVILRGVLPPHTRLPMHSHPVVDARAVLRGERTIVAADGAERTFRAGEGIVELVVAAHYGETRSEEAAELVMFCAGAGNLPLSEREE